MDFNLNRMAGQAFENPLGTLGTNLIGLHPFTLAGQAATKPLQNLAGKAVGPAATYQLVQQPGAMPQVAAVPGNLAELNQPTSVYDLYDPNKGYLAARAQQALLSDQTRAEWVKTAQSMYPFMEQAKKSELERDMAAAQIKANVLTNAQLMLGGAQTAQQMGLNAASQVGASLAQRYNY